MAVFAMVTAWVAPGLIDSIPGGKKDEFFQKLQSETGVEYTCTTNNICLIQGQWECIKQAHYALESLDNSRKTGEFSDAQKANKTSSGGEKFLTSGNLTFPQSAEDDVSGASSPRRRNNVIEAGNLAQESVRRWQTKCQKDKADAQNLNYFIYSQPPRKELVDEDENDDKDDDDTLLKKCTIFKVPGVTFHGLTNDRNDIEVVKESTINSSSESTPHRLKTLAGEIETVEVTVRKIGMGEKNDRNLASDEVEDDNEGRNKEKAKKKSSEKTTENDGDEIDAAETSTVCRKLQTKKSEKVTLHHRRKGNKPTKCKRSSSSVGEDYYDDLVEMTAKPAYNKTRRVTRSTTRSAARIIATKRRKITSPQQSLPVVEETETNNSPDDAEKETKKSKCEICGCETVDQRNLLQHVQRAHHERNHRCETCGRRYALLKDLTIHRKTHNERYVCNTCGRVYKQESVLKKHMLTHTADFVKPVFKCTECERTFSTRYTLTTHTAAVHRGEATSFLCPTCGKSFTQKHTLVEHQNVHLGVKPFTCDVCDMRFTFSSSLRQHRMKHDAVKRYKCVECGKDFTHRNSLRLHKVIHQKERPFQCQFCGRSFTQKQALQRHERIHRGERPFICEVCGRSFTDNSTLRRHINTHSKTPATTTTTPANSTSVKITGNTSTQIPQTSQPLINHLSPLSLPASAATALPTEHPQSPQVNNRLSPISSSRQQSTLTMLPSVTMPSSSIDIHQMQLAPPHQHPLHHHHSHHHHQQQQHLHPQQHHLQHPQHQQLPQPPPTIHQQMLHPGQQYSIAAAVPPISNSVYHTGLYDDSVMIPMSMMTNEDTIPMHY